MANLAIPQQGDDAASSSSGSTSGSSYDVFINHRGTDVKNTFASHLYRRLLLHGLRVFFDKKEMEEGLNISSQIEQAISSASVHIAIFSPTYAQSSWCLDELVLMINSGAVILPVFYKVQPSVPRWTVKGAYAEALRDLEVKRTDPKTGVDKPRYSSDTIQNWRNALSYAANLTGFMHGDDDDEGELLDKVVEGVLKKVQIVEEVLLQPLPESGFVGSGVEAAHTQLITWLNEPNPQARVIGVYGMAGVGKTALLRRVYNSIQEKKEVSGIFDSVIWLTVSQKYEIKDLQASIAEQLGFKLKEFPRDIDSRRMKLSASLGNKRFLLILDDVWRQIDLNEVGVKFGGHNQSKALISSRHKKVVEIMAENVEYCMMIQPLSEGDAWELFQRRAFRSGSFPDNLLAIAKDVAMECKGLPLAINVVAAALAPRKTVDEWNRSLDMMKNADPSFPSTHETIDAELYQRLRWSYNDLPDHNFQMCFLYCAAFPEDAHIRVERLVEMWTAEGLVPQKGRTYYMDVGREYIDALVDRCLLEYVDATEKGVIKVHDVLRDMGIYIGEGEEKWLFSASQDLDNFPNDEQNTHRKRISLVDNNITDLPADLECPTLVSLLLAENHLLEAIPERFFANFMCLKVLDLSRTKIKALPESVGKLSQLQFLNLERCDLLEDLPDSICNLSHLQFLNLDHCLSLSSLPDRIGELNNLKHLHVSNNDNGFIMIPHQISQLTSLNRLILSGSRTPLSAEDLSNLSNLIELDVEIEMEMKGVSMSTWSEMRILKLCFRWSEDGNGDYAALDILPRNMQSMKKLQSLELIDYLGVSLQSCICQFQNLKYLTLYKCRKLKELLALEVGSDAASGGFPMLERLELSFLDSLERIVWNEGTMLKLQSLKIYGCQALQTFQKEELPNLRSLEITFCGELKNCSLLRRLSMQNLPLVRKIKISGCPELEVDIGNLPMLETLELRNLEKLESIVWNEGTMLKLQSFEITGWQVFQTFQTGVLPLFKHFLEISCCGELKNWSRRLSMQNLPLVREITISCCGELEVDIGNLPMLETLELRSLEKLESIARSSSVWNEKTMPKLQKLMIRNCPLLRRLPVGMDTLPTLRLIVGELDWWEGIIWEDENVKTKLSQLFIDEHAWLSRHFHEEEGVTSDEESSQKEEIEEEEVLSDEEPSKKKRKRDVI